VIAVGTDDRKREAYKLHAQVCQVLSHPKRLEILDLLSEGEKSLEELTQAMGINKANVSQHLSLMRQRNLVSARKVGLRTFYRVANPKILRAWGIMREVALEQLESMEDLMRAMRGPGTRDRDPRR
jgi:ArsR family transcriptional regulator